MIRAKTIQLLQIRINKMKFQKLSKKKKKKKINNPKKQILENNLKVVPQIRNSNKMKVQKKKQKIANQKK